MSTEPNDTNLAQQFTDTILVAGANVSSVGVGSSENAADVRAHASDLISQINDYGHKALALSGKALPAGALAALGATMTSIDPATGGVLIAGATFAGALAAISGGSDKGRG